MKLTINEQSLPVAVYVTPFYFDKQPDDEIHFLLEPHGGEAFCCKRMTVERSGK